MRDGTGLLHRVKMAVMRLLMLLVMVVGLSSIAVGSIGDCTLGRVDKLRSTFSVDQDAIFLPPRSLHVADAVLVGEIVALRLDPPDLSFVGVVRREEAYVTRR